MVKRVSRSVRRRPELPAAAKLFAEALKLRQHREDAIDDDKTCPGRGQCSVCDHYEDLVAEISSVLHISPEEMHPLDVADVPAPPWWEPNQVDDWERARKLYVELCASAGLEPQSWLTLRDFDEGQTIVRWIERQIPVPAGLAGTGTPLRLRDWQRNVVRNIYASRGRKIRDVLEGSDPSIS